MKIFTLLLLIASAFAQVEAPQPSTTCVYHDKPCSKFVEKMIGQYPPAPVLETHDTWKEYAGKDAGFFTFRSKWNSPSLRSNRKVFDKKFIATHAAMWTIAVLACRDHARSGEDFGSEMPAMAAETGMDFVWSKWFVEAGGVLPAPIYNVIHYSLSMTK